MNVHKSHTTSMGLSIWLVAKVVVTTDCVRKFQLESCDVDAVEYLVGCQTGGGNTDRLLIHIYIFIYIYQIVKDKLNVDICTKLHIWNDVIDQAVVRRSKSSKFVLIKNGLSWEYTCSLIHVLKHKIVFNFHHIIT